MAILLLGSKNDAHIKAVHHALSQQDVSHHTVDIYKDMSAFDYVNEDAQTVLYFKGAKLSVNDSLFWRSPIQNNTPDEAFSIKEMCDQQEVWNYLLPMDSIAGLRCINPMYASFQMENKILQHKLANQVGLTMPQSLISSNRQRIFNFASQRGECIEKSLGMVWDEHGKPSSTRQLKLDDLSVTANMPRIFQTMINRKVEIRVYIVGDKVIPVAIHVTDQHAHKPDWRLAVQSYELCSISKTLTDKLVEYQRRAKLFYAAYDIIVDRSNNEYFLECNPSGNWVFLPMAISSKITDAISHVLTENAFTPEVPC